MNADDPGRDIPANGGEVLFICTGNYYRSRFAEAIFNHLARLAGLPWLAFSRGLAIHLADGTLSPLTEAALRSRGIDRSLTGPDRTPLTESDLIRAWPIIALKYQEHHPLMQTSFPAWADRITYWTVHDIDQADPDQALPKIETLVTQLFDNLQRTRPV